MGVDYQDVLKRLREERKKMSWSQREICQRICMTQAQYCKVENGEQYFSYDEVNALSDIGINVHYIFTGQKVSDCYTTEFENCNYIEIICLLEIIFSVVTRHYTLEKSVFWKGLYKELQYIRLLDATKNFNNNIFFQLRSWRNDTQKEMARRLGVDVKKLRMLEQGKCLPDSELLWRFYRDFQVSPVILLKDRSGLLYEAGGFLERIAAVSEKSVVEIKAFYKKN